LHVGLRDAISAAASAASKSAKRALLQSVEGAEDAVDQAARLTQQHEICRNDVVIAVAASGTTPFTFEAVRREFT
jgi:N-acetylmuramic acid 6-phosphate (MurNAc-6-P) etherase